MRRDKQNSRRAGDFFRSIAEPRALALLALLILLNGTAASQTAEPQGTITSISFDPANADTVYVGSYGSAYWSEDAGESWHRSSEPMVAWSLAVSPARPGDDAPFGRVIYAATQARGVLRSLDLGQTWGGDPAWTETIRSLASRRDGTAAYAGSASAIYRTNDRGLTWDVLSDQLGDGIVTAIALIPQDPSLIYVAKQDRGVFRSTDGGVTWDLGDAGMSDTRVIDMDVQPSNPSMLYASTLAGVYRSVDAGTSWIQVPFPESTYELDIDETNPERMYAATTLHGVYRSLDGGLSWSAINAGLGSIVTFFTVGVAPDGSGHVYAGSKDYGLFASADYGDNWHPVGDTLLPGPEPDTQPPASGGAPNLELSIVDLQNGGSVAAGSDAHYRIELRNTGQLAAVDTQVHVGWVLTAFIVGDDDPMARTLNPSKGTCDSKGDCQLGDLAPGSTVSIDFSGATKPHVLGTYRLTVVHWTADTGKVATSRTIGSSVTVLDSDGGGGAIGLFELLALLASGFVSRRRASPPLSSPSPRNISSGPTGCKRS